MNRLVCFLMVGLAFTVLQVSTVAAQQDSPICQSGDPAADAACREAMAAQTI